MLLNAQDRDSALCYYTMLYSHPKNNSQPQPEPHAEEHGAESNAAERAGNVYGSEEIIRIKPPNTMTIQQSLFDKDAPVPNPFRNNDEDGGYADRAMNPYWNGVVRVRLFRWTCMVVTPCILLILLTNDREWELPLLLGIGIEIAYVVYFMLVAFLFWTGVREQDGEPRYLFRIWTRSASVRGWSKMTIAAEQQRYQLNAIESISEFSAVDGGVSTFMLANLGPFTWAIVFMHFAAELAYSDVFSWDIADVCEMIGVSGLVMIGMFELNPYNAGMQMCHYIGAAAGVGTIAGYVLQAASRSEEIDNYSPMILPIIICVIAGSCFLLWQWSNSQTAKKVLEFHKAHTNATYEETTGSMLCIPCPCCKGETLTPNATGAYKITKPPTDEEWPEIRKAINAMSIKNVVFEGVFLFCGATSLAIWLMSYHESCSRGCAGVHNPTPAL